MKIKYKPLKTIFQVGRALKKYVLNRNAYNRNNGNVVRVWARKYELFGESSLYDKPHNKSYSANLKIEAVKAYINGKASIEEICFR